MKNDTVTAALLLDFYGDLLTGRQREIFELYHGQDLSLSEIAQDAGITRQGVRDALARAGAALDAYEDKLGLVARFLRVRAAFANMRGAADTISALCAADAPEIRTCAETIARTAALCEEVLYGV
ncbi:MAG: YlxM family DNA-binding protein [Oscillospiraceae bacterium]|jgi:predicted DNA-binding protein YlxM (UPF0122 family)|nr:YlxM family DNA-binding protein [Oscillospiraceae bacterium]